MSSEHGPLSDAGEPAQLRVIIADDDPIARRVIRDRLHAAGICVIAEAANGREAVDLTLYYGPDVVLMDVVMPEVDGLTATRRIRERRPHQVVVMLSSADDDVGIAGLHAGASGFLSKDLDIEALPRAVHGAAAGQAAVSREMAMQLIEELRRRPEGTTGLRPVKSALTGREWEVLDLLCEHKTTEDIAATLVLSSETVRSHVKNILRKLNVRSRQEAVLAAQEMRRTV